MPRDQQELFLCAAEKMLNRLVELDMQIVEEFVRTGDRTLVAGVLPTAT